MDNENAIIKLLLVDDEEEFRDAAKQALKRQKFEVLEAESGERALEILATTRPDVIVLDLKMGGMDGISTLGAIRKMDRDLPVLILTGHGKYEDALAGIQLGVADFVQKPVELKELGARIRKLVATGSRKPLRERTIGELMVPASLYQRIYSDQSVRQAVETLLEIQMRPLADEDTDRGRRTLLVFDRQQQFVGLIRAEDIVRVIIPTWLESPYSSYFTGMFLAQAKVVGSLRLGDMIRSPTTIDIDAPLMEAAHVLASKRLSHLPVTKKGKLVGVLRPEDLYQEITTPLP